MRAQCPPMMVPCAECSNKTMVLFTDIGLFVLKPKPNASTGKSWISSTLAEFMPGQCQPGSMNRENWFEEYPVEAEGFRKLF